MKFKRTKPFLLATAGSTVDGRNIDDKMIEEMASSYDPKTYGARLNIEHIRGISADPPFRAYGDVVSLSVGEIDVNFNGKTEKRKALYGVFDVLADAEKMNAQGQKVYPSIEIEPNFGGKGFAYLMGCALTDSPASIATERLSFNRSLPGSIRLDGGTALALEFADESGAPTDEGKSFLKGLQGVLDGFVGKVAPKTEPAPANPANPAQPAAFDAAAFSAMFGELGKTIEGALNTQAQAFRTEIDGIAVKLADLSKTVEATPAPGQKDRPLANGGTDHFSKLDC